jgi:hypothetical protein
MPMWAVYLVEGVCGVAIIWAILALTPLWDKMPKKKAISASSPVISTANYDNITRIAGEEPTHRFPLIYNITLAACSLVLLAVGLWSTYLWIVGKISAPNGWEWILFLLLVVFPIWVMWDIVITEPRQYKLGKSRVARERILYFVEDASPVFNRALQAMNTMKASIVVMERPKLIKARWTNSIISVTVTNVGHGRVKVVVFVDSRWITTKWDFGSSQKSVDTFERLLLTPLGKSTSRNDYKG